MAERRGEGLGGRGSGLAELLDERTRGKGLAGLSAGNRHRQAAFAAVFMVARLAASSVSIAAKGSGPGAGVAKADEQLAIVVDDVVDGQADQAGVRRYSDDHHIVRELGEPHCPVQVIFTTDTPAS